MKLKMHQKLTKKRRAKMFKFQVIYNFIKTDSLMFNKLKKVLSYLKRHENLDENNKKILENCIMYFKKNAEHYEIELLEQCKTEY